MLEKIKEHENGELSFEEFQEISNWMVKIKYWAEVSYQNYKLEVESYNQLIGKVETDYFPVLKKI